MLATPSLEKSDACNAFQNFMNLEDAIRAANAKLLLRGMCDQAGEFLVNRSTAGAL